MGANRSLDDSLCAYVDRRAGRLVELAQELIRIPSENTPPVGTEAACQERLAAELRRCGWTPELYRPDEVAGIREHPLFWPGREYANRPNLGARRAGAGGGRSLVLSGHIDTVPRGTQPWTRDPFGGAVEGGRIYGRGANDMKGGVATNLFAVEALGEMGMRLAGDLVFETVVDEEFGGSNGTLAGRLRGYNGDAAVIAEPSFLRVCPAQRGGRTAHITFRAPGGVLTDGAFPAGAVDQLAWFLNQLPEFARQRRERAPVHEMYAGHPDPAPVSVTKVFTAPWGTREPITVPETCQVELYWQLMPGETQQDVEREFFVWFDALVGSAARLFPTRPEVQFPIRWLPGSSLPGGHPLVAAMSAAAESALGAAPVVAGIEGPCDLYVFQQAFGIPAILWGARGGNTHAADEYVEIDSLIAAAKALLCFICRWCGVAE